MALYRLSGPTETLVAPALIAAFDGWVDAAGAATAAAGRLADDAEAVASFDPDLLFDYRARRPVLDIVDGIPTRAVWPELVLRRVRRDGRDLLVLTGGEPDFRWRELGDDILELALRLGVVEWVSLGAIPAAVPHTRAVPILATASRHGLLSQGELQGPSGLLRVPSAALSAVELAVSGGGIPTVGFYAQVPHYVGGIYPAATIALLDHLGQHLGLEIALGDLPEEARNHRQRLDAAVAADEDSRNYLARLEAAAGEEAIPSGDELATEIERFLRGEAGENETGQGPFGGR